MEEQSSDLKKHFDTLDKHYGLLTNHTRMNNDI
ncbi:unnamed protein product, partial [marine sediment metagenome]